MISTDELRRRAKLETVVRLSDVEAEALADELDELRDMAAAMGKELLRQAREDLGRGS